MERISADCAMEWSIELDKGLRSRRPGEPVEAISRIGPRLEQWDREPGLTIAEYNFFRLVPGEDRLFANAILLRLVDAFGSGDKDTKLCVVKIFLSDLRHRRKRKRGNDGILSKYCLENRVELLSRVKLIYDTGDSELKVLSLILFGCWAGFAKDSASIRYTVVSSLISCHVAEVKASLFAAGCFSELSEDFASVLLEMLVDMLNSSETLSTVRVAGAHAFAKIGCTSLLANRGYKAGLKLLFDSTEEDFIVVMLISLSVLSSKSTLLMSKQVDLLFSFLTEEKSLRLQATTVRCMQFLLSRGTCLIHAGADSFNTLFIVLNDSKYPPALQCRALRIFHKIFSYGLSTSPGACMLEFPKLLAIFENATQSPIMPKRILAIRILVNISAKLKEKKDMALALIDSDPLAHKLILFLMNRLTLLVKLALDLRQLNPEIEEERQSLFSFLLMLVEEQPDLCGLLLDKISLFVEYLVTTEPVNKIEGVGVENSMSITLNFLSCVSKLTLACLENLNEAVAITTQIHAKMRLLVEHVLQCGLIDSYIHSVFSLLFHYHITFYCLLDKVRETNNILDNNLCRSLQDYHLQHETISLECAKKMFAVKDNWSAYRAGKYAACQGAWFMAEFVFGHLKTTAKSNSCCCWLKSLAQFAHCERQIQSLILPKQGFALGKYLDTNGMLDVSFRDGVGEISQQIDWKVHSTFYIRNIMGACSCLHLSVETVGATVTEGQSFLFQRWFLALRAKILQHVVDILQLLVKLDKVHESGQERIIMVEGPSNWSSSLFRSLTQKSLQLKRISWELDLIANSFIGMDSRSSKIISAIALSCSMLAFSTGFALFIPKLHTQNYVLCHLENSEDCLHTVLVQDLLTRMSHIDSEAKVKLGLLLKMCGQPKSYSLPHDRSQIFSGYEARGILTICDYAVASILDLQNEASRSHDDEIQSQVRKSGLQLLLDIIMKWMHIPFRTPIYFFRVRPCITSELFATTQESRAPDEILVSRGFHLSLNLCLQLKNVPPDLAVRLTKLYCILHCKTSFQIPKQSGENKGQISLRSSDWNTDDLVDLNEKLLRYVTGYTKNIHGSLSGNHAENRGAVDACVCFELNERGQGFSTCLLDVSTFPVGSYRIKWQSCCIDDDGSCWNILPHNVGPVFTVR